MIPKFCKATFWVLIFLYAGHLSAQVAAVNFTVYVPSVKEDDKGVYIAGSFNYWHAADSLYRMHKVSDGVYSITLPLFDKMEYQYKYTAGNWDRVEIAVNDSNISNRNFYAINGKSITDTVMKWKQPQPAEKRDNPKLEIIAAKKDSLLAKLQPKLDVMLQQLRLYVENLLQENPSAGMHRRLDKQTIRIIGNAYTQVTGLLWEIMAILNPEQKKRMLIIINKPEAKADFLNTFSKALDSMLKEKEAGRN
ncbi:MAG: glycogen-binding domain-containing protein [Chitinophagaceae bacterium]|nr:glycogen-binding domain-containing protein [Chitinophagaceae bacterium]